MNLIYMVLAAVLVSGILVQDGGLLVWGGIAALVLAPIYLLSKK